MVVAVLILEYAMDCASDCEHHPRKPTYIAKDIEKSVDAAAHISHVETHGVLDLQAFVVTVSTRAKIIRIDREVGFVDASKTCNRHPNVVVAL